MTTESASEITLARRPRLVDEVTALLRDRIMTSEIPPGTLLRQIEMAERLGVSRTPLREALRILEQDGLVRISNGNKTVEVVGFSGDDMRELYQVREVIDGLAARLAAERGLSAAADEQIRARCEEMSEIGRQEILDVRRYSEAHVGFHVGILEASGNGRLLTLIPLVRMSAHRALRHMGVPEMQGRAPLRVTLDISDSHHHAIYQAIKERVPDLAEALARRHISETLECWVVRDEIPAGENAVA